MARSITGVVASDKGDKTIVVNVQTRKTHPIYKKQYTVGKRFMAHDEKNEANVGDKVIITETRPISARKRFALTKIVEKAGVEHVEPSTFVEQIDNVVKSAKKKAAVKEEPEEKE